MVPAVLGKLPSDQKIDAAVAVMMAIGRAMAEDLGIVAAMSCR
jgi:hypothetical protein